jgi:hypothetical protein
VGKKIRQDPSAIHTTFAYAKVTFYRLLPCVNFAIGAPTPHTCKIGFQNLLADGPAHERTSSCTSIYLMIMMLSSLKTCGVQKQFIYGVCYF